jgi:hypothetical protein
VFFDKINQQQMKTNFKIVFLVLIVLCTGFIAKAQHLNIETINGQVITESLNSIENITLPNENLVIHFSDSEPTTLSLYSIKKIYFDMETSSGQEIKPIINNPAILTNPAKNELEIVNLPDKQVMAVIYSIQGEQLAQTWVSSEVSTLNIQHLTGGLYILKIDGVTLKFVKK